MEEVGEEESKQTNKQTKNNQYIVYWVVTNVVLLKEAHFSGCNSTDSEIIVAYTRVTEYCRSGEKWSDFGYTFKGELTEFVNKLIWRSENWVD